MNRYTKNRKADDFKESVKTLESLKDISAKIKPGNQNEKEVIDNFTSAAKNLLSNINGQIDYEAQIENLQRAAKILRGFDAPGETNPVLVKQSMELVANQFLAEINKLPPASQDKVMGDGFNKRTAEQKKQVVMNQVAPKDKKVTRDGIYSKIDRLLGAMAKTKNASDTKSESFDSLLTKYNAALSGMMAVFLKDDPVFQMTGGKNILNIFLEQKASMFDWSKQILNNRLTRNVEDRSIMLIRLQTCIESYGNEALLLKMTGNAKIDRNGCVECDSLEPLKAEVAKCYKAIVEEQNNNPYRLGSRMVNLLEDLGSRLGMDLKQTDQQALVVRTEPPTGRSFKG